MDTLAKQKLNRARQEYQNPGFDVLNKSNLVIEFVL